MAYYFAELHDGPHKSVMVPVHSIIMARKMAMKNIKQNPTARQTVIIYKGLYKVDLVESIDYDKGRFYSSSWTKCRIINKDGTLGREVRYG